MIEFEHSLFKILLLVAILSVKPPGRKWLPLVITAGLLLAFLPPPLSIPIPWNLLLGIIIPLLLWQNSRRIVTAQWSGRWKDVLMWIGSAILFTLVFWAFKELELFGAILFGLVSTSLIWGVGETENTTSIISLIGPFTLIFLLVEVEQMIQSPTHYIGGIFSGFFFGAIFASIAVLLSRNVNPRIKNWIPLIQIYLSYTVAYLTGVSAVAASLASVIVFVTVGLYIDLWPFKQVKPTPLNTWPGFIFILTVFILLGWESHIQPSNLFWLEVITGFVLSLMIAWVGKRLRLVTFPQSIPLWQIGLRVSLLLFPALLFWPGKIMEQPILLAYAFGTTVLSFVIARVILSYFFD